MNLFSFWPWNQYQMNFQQLLREEHYLLKNQITELKNAFNINRDILNILSKGDNKKDLQHSLFLKIIFKLTELNNQAMMNVMELMQEKNVLKAQIYRLNVQLNHLDERLDQQIENSNKMVTTPTDVKLVLHEQFSKLSRQLLAFNEQRIAYEQEIAFWKHNCIKQQKIEQNEIYELQNHTPFAKKNKIKRKYTSNQYVKNDWIVIEQQRQIRKLKQIIEQLQNRLDILIKAHNLQQEMAQKNEEKFKYRPQWQKQLCQIGLFKYALNVISVRKNNNDLYMSITHRFRHHMDPELRKNRKVHSWPKHKQFKYQGIQQDNTSGSFENTLQTEDSK